MISVCIPTYNGEKYIKEQLDSILIQLEKEDEVIISDDSSSDRTIEIIKSYNDSRISLIENCKFQSPIFNLENALKHAKGDYIFLSDQDDIWKPDKVKVVLSHLLNSDLIVSQFKFIDENGIEIKNDGQFRLTPRFFFHELYSNPYLGCAMAFNRKILNYSLPFPSRIAMHDIWIGLLTKLVGKVEFISDELILYRRHHNNFSPSFGKSNFSFFFKLKYRLLILFYLVKRVYTIKLKNLRLISNKILVT